MVFCLCGFSATPPAHFFITNLHPPIRKVGKSGLLKRLYAPALEICNASASCFASITSGMASNGSLLIKSPFPHEKAAATISVSARSARLRAAKRTPRARPARSAANTRRSRSFLRANPRRIRSTPTPVRPDLWTFRTTLGTLLPSTMWSTRVS